MDDFLHGLLFAATLELLLALVLILATRAKHRRTTGAARIASCAERHYRNLCLPVVAAIAIAVLVLGAPEPLLFLTLLLAAAACLWLRPHADDEVYGALGVQRGWRSRRFEELEEWRLTGDHLRFRIGETWLAVGVPAGEHDQARALLEERCPERESRFSR